MTDGRWEERILPVTGVYPDHEPVKTKTMRINTYFLAIDRLIDMKVLEKGDPLTLFEKDRQEIVADMMKITKGHVNPEKVREDINRAWDFHIHGV